MAGADDLAASVLSSSSDAAFHGLARRLTPALCGIVAGAAAYATEFVLFQTAGATALVLVVPFVAVAAWFGGARSGIATTVTASLLLTIFPLLPEGISVQDRRFLVAVISTTAVGTASAVLADWLRSTEHRLIGLISARDALLDERTALLRAVLSSEERWQVLTDAVPALITQISPEGEIIYCNRRMVEYTGCTIDQLRSGGWASAVHPGDLEEGRRRWNEAMISGTRLEFQQRVRDADGAYRRQLVIGEPVRAASGQITSWLSALVDIEDIKRAEDALSASERESRMLSDAIPALVALIDLEITGNRHYRNQAFYDYTGFNDEQALDWWNQGLVKEEDVRAVAEAWREATTKGQMATAEMRVRRYDGAFRWHLVRAVPLDSLTRWLLVATDIDDQKTAERAVMDALAAREEAVARHRFAEEQLTLLVEASSGLIESLELDELVPRILSMSMKFIVADAYALWSLDDDSTHWRMLTSEGLSPAYLADRSVIDVTELTARMTEPLAVEDVRTDPRLDGRLDGYASEGIRSLFVLPLAVAGANTGTLTFYYRSPHVFDDAEVRIGTALANIAASALGLARLNRGEQLVREGLQEANDRLARLADDLQEANAVKDEFLGMVSHELKTPITMILGGSEILARHGDLVGAEDRAAALADIHESAKRLGQLIDNLLLLSRLEAGTVIEFEPILVRHEIARIVAEYRKREPDREFTVTIDPVISPVAADPTNFQQILQNLLGNAIKYSPPGSPIEVVTERRGGELVVSVLDHGKGITPEELEMVFEPFYRSKRTSHGTAGAGVGLAVCRRLIEAQGGRIWAQPRQGGGSIFSMALPIDPTAD